jgi:hypothetical protein
VEAPWDPETPWQEDTGWLRGLDLFDRRYFWEAHETWEAVWHQVPRDDPYRDLLQGMIQVAAALLKHHLGHDKAAKRLLQRGTARLERVQLAGQHHCRGLALARSMASWEAFLSDGPWPGPLGP